MVAAIVGGSIANDKTSTSCRQNKMWLNSRSRPGACLTWINKEKYGGNNFDNHF